MLVQQRVTYTKRQLHFVNNKIDNKMQHGNRKDNCCKVVLQLFVHPAFFARRYHNMAFLEKQQVIGFPAFTPVYQKEQDLDARERKQYVGHLRNGVCQDK